MNVLPRGLITAVLLLAGTLLGGAQARVYSEKQLEAYLRDVYETEKSEDSNEMQLRSWDTEIDLGNATIEEAATATELKNAAADKAFWAEYVRDSHWQNFTDPRLRRQMMLLADLGTTALDEDQLTELSSHTTAMAAIFSRARICPYTNQHCDLAQDGINLDPDVKNVMEKSVDLDELSYVWTAWRRQTGPDIRPHYKRYVELENTAARLNGYRDMGEMWRSEYDTPTFVDDIDALWEQVKPLYVNLYTHVKRKLEIRFENKLVLGPDGLLPAHVFGDMWAQSWESLYDLVRPYPEATPFNITASLVKQNYTVVDMFELANDFFLSLGLPSNDMAYDEQKGAIITKPLDRDIVCHASAWDFYDGKDFRIKMCTQVTAEDLVVIHHEMGHIQYYIQYKDQPYAFREGANEGFQEAVGDTIALSVDTPYHLAKVGLLDDFTDSPENSLNALTKMALNKVAFLPFGLLVDKWRWDVFSGKVNESQWNSHWWKLREEIQLVKAPVDRAEADFDPAAKYHISSDATYIPYFVAIILQFQFHRALCIEAGQYDPADNGTTGRPLHKCDIHGSLPAGKTLMKGLSLGTSQHWSEVLQLMVGSRKLDASALLEYFRPLTEYLEAENARETPASQTVLFLVGGILAFSCIAALLCYLVHLVRKKKQVDQTLDLSSENHAI